jgi:hypothetical protein
MNAGLQLYTLLHVVISLVGIFTGLVALFGQLAGPRLERWTAWFLASTVLTSVTGFGFPFERFLPAHAIGIVSLLLLAAAIYACYVRRLDGVWRRVYVMTAVVALYFNAFVLMVQLFRRLPALAALAPTQSEWPFVLTQLVLLVTFGVLGGGALKRAKAEVAGGV